MNHAHKLNLPRVGRDPQNCFLLPLLHSAPQSISVLSLRTGTIPLKEESLLETPAFLNLTKEKQQARKGKVSFFIYMFNRRHLGK